MFRIALRVKEIAACPPSSAALFAHFPRPLLARPRFTVLDATVLCLSLTAARFAVNDRRGFSNDRGKHRHPNMCALACGFIGQYDS